MYPVHSWISLKIKDMHNKIIMLIISILAIEGLCAQNVNKINFPRYAENTRMEMRIPNQINGFITLKGDLHTHTYFSDGSVSPDMRVDEAWKTGLDVLAITDHIEYKTCLLYTSPSPRD